MAAVEGHMPTIECMLQHCLLDAASGADHIVKSAIWLSTAACTKTPDLDANTKQSVSQRLLLPAVRSNTAAAKAAVQQSMKPAGASVCSALIDALLMSDAVDLDEQRTELQHLMVSVAAMHRQQPTMQQGATKHARLALHNAARVVVAAAFAATLAMLGLLPVAAALLVMLLLT
jgi:hypothetical protein